MKGSENVLQSPSSTAIVFRRNKTERLDWRKIASLDVDKLIQEADVETLKAILPEITFCKADAEFDDTKTDPGFRKVFQLGQLIIEYLLHTQTVVSEKTISLEQKWGEMVEENKQYKEDLKNLKEKLTDAKKELKKRKEMLVSNQNEMMGANKDEYDQCPHCAKRFIASVYLFSHMQRRHQGLPLHPMFTTQSQPTISTDYKLQQQYGILRTNSDMRSTAVGVQTDSNMRAEYNDFGEIHTIDDDSANRVNSIMEKYLQQKYSTGEVQGILSARRPSTTVGPTSRNALEVVDLKIAKFREDIDSQWKTLAEKFHQDGIQDLKSTIMGEMQRLKEEIVLTTSNTEMKALQLKEEEMVSAAKIEDAEKRFEKKEHELEVFRENIEKKMEVLDVIGIEGKLESQERFWRSKLQQVEELYQQQAQKLRQDFQASIINTHIARSPTPGPDKSDESVQEIKIVSPESRSESPGLHSIPDNQIVENKMAELKQLSETVKGIESPLFSSARMSPQSPGRHNNPIILRTPSPSPKNTPIPVARPRATHTISNSITPKVKAALNKINATPRPATPSHHKSTKSLNHEYEEPKDFRRTGVVSDYSSSEVSTPSDERIMKRKRLRNKTNSRQIANIKTDKVTQMSLIRSKVIQDVNKQMKELGLNPDGSGFDNGATIDALTKIKHRRKKREKDDQKFKAKRKSVKDEVKFSAAQQITKKGLERPLMASPKKPGSKSPLVKMFTAVRAHGSTWRKRVSKSLAKRRSIAAQSANSDTTPSKPKLKTFFTRFIKTPEKAKEDAVASQTEESEGDATSSAKSSDEPNMPMITKSKPILVDRGKSGKGKGKSETTSEESQTSEQEEDHNYRIQNFRKVNKTIPIPPIIRARPVERDLLKAFEAVEASTGRGGHESRDHSPSRSASSGQTPSEEISDLSEPESPKHNEGHYVSLRPPSPANPTTFSQNTGTSWGQRQWNQNLPHSRREISPRRLNQISSVSPKNPPMSSSMSDSESENKKQKVKDYTLSADSDDYKGGTGANRMYPSTSSPGHNQRSSARTPSPQRAYNRVTSPSSIPRPVTAINSKASKRDTMKNSWDSDME